MTISRNLKSSHRIEIHQKIMQFLNSIPLCSTSVAYKNKSPNSLIYYARDVNHEQPFPNSAGKG
jgi:hypothetical protein